MNTHRIIPAVMIVLLPALASAQGGGGGSSDLRVSGKLISDLPTGDPPLQVNSTTNVPNLSADKLDGFDVGDFAVEGSGVGVHYKNLVGAPVKEIDKLCALNGDCFPGDDPGFPVTIAQRGSYRLAGNLDIASETDAENTTVIEVLVDDVTIDLAGFTIRGPVACTGDPVTGCSPTGTGEGIDFQANGNTFLGTVKNGVIRGVGDNGIDAAESISVENVRITECGDHGIVVDSGIARVKDSVVYRNLGHGIRGALQVTDSVVQGNGQDGIYLNPGGTAQRNQVDGNGGDGIRCAGCLVLDNQIYENAGYGLEAATGASYGRNLIYANTTGDINSTGTNHQIAPNSCGSGSTGSFAC